MLRRPSAARLRASLLGLTSLAALSGCVTALGDIEFDKHEASGGGGGATSSSSSATGSGGGCQCDPLATCTDGVCACPAGYTDDKGDGSQCTDVDECAAGGKNDCNPGHSTCTNTPGSYSCACAPGFVGSTCDTCVRFVDAGSTAATQDGLTWAGAYASLAAALTAAAEQKCEVWVKEGTYHAYDATNLSGFVLQDGVSLYGGFAGTEADRASADPTLHPTILDARDAAGANAAYHVLFARQLTATVDGFTLRGGAATGADQDSTGGGLVAISDTAGAVTAVTLSRCEIADNTSNSAGGGVAGNQYDGTVSLTLVDCDIHDNQSDVAGGLASGAQVTLTRTSIRNNLGRSRTGGMELGTESRLTATDLTITGNVSAISDTGGLQIGGTATLTNLIVGENYAAGVGAGMVVVGGSATIQNGLFYGNVAASNGGLTIYDQTSVSCESCTITGNRAFSTSPGTGPDGLSWGNTAPTLVNTIIYADSSRTAGVETYGVATLASQYCDVRGMGQSGTNIDSAPQFVSVPVFFDRTSGASSNAQTLMVRAPSDYKSQQYVEVGGDGVSRRVTGTSGDSEIIVDPPLGSATAAGTALRFWGTAMAAALDFHLSSGSPCAGKGSPTTFPPSDLAGDARTSPPNIGCY